VDIDLDETEEAILQALTQTESLGFNDLVQHVERVVSTSSPKISRRLKRLVDLGIVKRTITDDWPPRTLYYLPSQKKVVVPCFPEEFETWKGIPSPRASPYAWAAATTLCFLLLFVFRPNPPILYRVSYSVVQIVALLAVIHAYRHIRSIGYLLWLVPIVIELMFWPRFVVQLLWGQSFWVPFWIWNWDEKAFLFLILFIVGLYLTRRTYSVNLNHNPIYTTSR
jgi:hypothetical protein